MQLFLILAVAFATAGLYETVVYFVNRQQPDRNADARRHRVRRLNQDGDF